MIDLSDLISRVEKASGPDRELDLAVHLALFPDSEIAGWMKYPRGLEGREGYSWDIHRACVVFEKRTADGRCPHNGGVPLPFYTSSLDAVLTLLPEGHSYALGDCNEDNVPWACVTRCSGDWPDFAATGADVILALLSAVLRARQAMQMEPHHER